MLDSVKRLFRSSERSDGEETKVMDRLQRACARELAAHEGFVPADPEAILPERPTSDGTQSVSDDTHIQIALERTAFGAAKADPAPAAPSVLRRVLSWLKASAPALRDFRSSARRQVHRQLKVLVGPCRWPATVTDISATGIGLILGLWHRPGTSVPLLIEDSKRDISWAVTAQVVRVDLLPDDQWFTCCRFEKPLEEHQVKSWS
jgi:hypothetical protein